MSSDPNPKLTTISKLDKAIFAFAILLAIIAFANAGVVIYDVFFDT